MKKLFKWSILTLVGLAPIVIVGATYADFHIIGNHAWLSYLEQNAWEYLIFLIGWVLGFLTLAKFYDTKDEIIK